MKLNVEEEFFKPTLGLDLEQYVYKKYKLGAQHIARYHWVKEVIEDRNSTNILDIACGCGYGSYILSRHLTSSNVVGVDYDINGITMAKDKYTNINLKYMQGDMVTWATVDNTPIGKFDTIVSFDTLEHIEHRDLVLLNLTRNLSDNGMLVLSTPCSHLVKLNPIWDAHKLEYSCYDLVCLLKHFFEIVLTPNNNDLPHLDFWKNLNKEWAEQNNDDILYWTHGNPLVCLNPIKTHFSSI